MSDCIIAVGSTLPKGYVRVYRNGKQYLAHRVAYAEANGLDIKTMGGVVMHSCDKPPCINPDHLSLGAHKDNVADKVRKGRQSRSGNAKLTDEQVAYIRLHHVQGHGGNTRALASMLNVAPQHINRVTSGSRR